jgi:hypothetical protein
VDGKLVDDAAPGGHVFLHAILCNARSSDDEESGSAVCNATAEVSKNPGQQSAGGCAGG